MNVFAIILAAIAIGAAVLLRRNRGDKPLGNKNNTTRGAETPSGTPAPEEKKSRVPSVYTIRANNRWLRGRSILPRLIMWGVLIATVTGGLALLNPTEIMKTFRVVGPSVVVFLVGFGVLGFGRSLEEKHQSYEYSWLGWGGAIVLWCIAIALFFK